MIYREILEYYEYLENSLPLFSRAKFISAWNLAAFNPTQLLLFAIWDIITTRIQRLNERIYTVIDDTTDKINFTFIVQMKCFTFEIDSILSYVCVFVYIVCRTTEWASYTRETPNTHILCICITYLEISWTADNRIMRNGLKRHERIAHMLREVNNKIFAACDWVLWCLGTLIPAKIFILRYWQQRTCVIKIICLKSPRIQ